LHISEIITIFAAAKYNRWHRYR